MSLLRQSTLLAFSHYLDRSGAAPVIASRESKPRGDFAPEAEAFVVRMHKTFRTNLHAIKCIFKTHCMCDLRIATSSRICTNPAGVIGQGQGRGQQPKTPAHCHHCHHDRVDETTNCWCRAVGVSVQLVLMKCCVERPRTAWNNVSLCAVFEVYVGRKSVTDTAREWFHIETIVLYFTEIRMQWNMFLELSGVS